MSEARIVCNGGRYTAVQSLLTECGWMSVRQLVSYHRVLLMYKIRTEGKPRYFVKKFSSNPNPPYRTRFNEQESVKKQRIPKHEDYMKSFVPSSIDIWNRLPIQVRQASNVETFKSKLKAWIKTNIEI